MRCPQLPLEPQLFDAHSFFARSNLEQSPATRCELATDPDVLVVALDDWCQVVAVIELDGPMPQRPPGVGIETIDALRRKVDELVVTGELGERCWCIAYAARVAFTND